MSHLSFINTTKILLWSCRLSHLSLECFQFESSRLLLFCSEPQLQSRTMMLCRLGSTIPSRGLWEGSPFQQASISCQHSSSKLGSRSGLAPREAMDTWVLFKHSCEDYTPILVSLFTSYPYCFKPLIQNGQSESCQLNWCELSNQTETHSNYLVHLIWCESEKTTTGLVWQMLRMIPEYKPTRSEAERRILISAYWAI